MFKLNCKFEHVLLNKLWDRIDLVTGKPHALNDSGLQKIWKDRRRTDVKDEARKEDS